VYVAENNLKSPFEKKLESITTRNVVVITIIVLKYFLDISNLIIPVLRFLYNNLSTKGKDSLCLLSIPNSNYYQLAVSPIIYVRVFSPLYTPATVPVGI